jgi:DNA-binding CsgD family transcriptional regulator
VYDAATDASLWTSLLEVLAKSCRADSAALVMHNLGQEVHTISAGWEMDPEAGRRYQQHYGAVDVWASRGRSKPSGYVCSSESLCTTAELVTTEIYNDFMVPYGLAHGMFALVENNAARWASISMYRSPLSGNFRTSDLDVLNLLVPHMQRAFKLHFQFSELNVRNQSMESALNLLTTGVVFLGTAGIVLSMNSKAEEILSRADGLLLHQGKLRAALYTEASCLVKIINGAVATGKGQGCCAGGTMRISRKKRRPLAVTIAPLHEFKNGFSERAAAVLFISDLDQNLELPANLLQRCYGLTAAEARLAMILLEGHSLTEAAASCGVTQNTVRSQLKSVFLKTEVNRQSELIRLLLNTAGVLRPKS